MKVPKFLKRGGRRSAASSKQAASSTTTGTASSESPGTDGASNLNDEVKLLDDVDDYNQFCFDHILLDVDTTRTCTGTCSTDAACTDKKAESGNTTCKSNRSSSCSTLSTEIAEEEDFSDPWMSLDNVEGPIAGSTCKDSTSSNATLKLTNYVDQPWDLELLESKLLEYQCHSILFVDVIPAKNFRRWQFQKTRLCRQLIPLMEKHKEMWKTVQFQSTLKMDLDLRNESLDPRTLASCVDTTVTLLGQVQQDVDIVSLQFHILQSDFVPASDKSVSSQLSTSKTPPQQQQQLENLQTIVLALIGLLSLRDRSWYSISFYGIDALDPSKDNDADFFFFADSPYYQCRRILDEASIKFGVPIKVEPASY
ncbi:expressed unknown protein [Seminavis robusta]|uniref:Uncharacterized protein n=1 Tax=Seminavis robusta TaxID=568900 RepID=A0A9N8DRB1_9STRA|nr:expressed unknown protein [Seminavis robusta]|eukprot:Sro226_g091970.1 n/a (367) ;mRNA; f:18501-19601